MATAPVAEMVAELRRRIAEGDLQPGDQLPPTRALMAEFGLSDYAVYRAIAILKAEGYAVSQQGKGVFAAMPGALISGERRIHRGITQPGETIHHLSSTRVPAPGWVAALLDADRCVNRVRTVNRGELILQASQSWVHLDVAAVVEEVDEPRACNPSWQALYERRSSCAVQTVSQEVDTRITTEDDRRALGLERSHPVLVLRSVYASNGRTIGVGEGVYAPGQPLKLDTEPS